MSAGAAIPAPPLAPDPVALHADKLRAMVTDIRTNHPNKGGRTALPWSEIAEWINSNPSMVGVQFRYSKDSIRCWHSGKDASTAAMLSSMSAYCIAHSEYQAREMRADARNMKRDADGEAGATAEASADSFMSPTAKRTKWGPQGGSKQAATPVKINGIEYLTPPKHVIITKAQESKYKAAEAELEDLKGRTSKDAALQHVRTAAAAAPAAFDPVVVSLWQRALGAVPGSGREAIATVGALAAVAVVYSLGLGAALAGGCTDLLQHVPGSESLHSFSSRRCPRRARWTQRARRCRRSR